MLSWLCQSYVHLLPSCRKTSRNNEVRHLTRLFGRHPLKITNLITTLLTSISKTSPRITVLIGHRIISKRLLHENLISRKDALR